MILIEEDEDYVGGEDSAHEDSNRETAYKEN